jgi:pentose-5-phosphate-3-epimerase
MSWREWIRTVEVVPALGSADPATVENQVEALLRAGCRVFHLRSRDDLDQALDLAGRVAPVLRRYGGILDVQIDSPASPTVFVEVAGAGGNSVTFPLETAGDVVTAVDAAHEAGLSAGVVYAVGTDPLEAAQQVGEADLVRCPARTMADQLDDLRVLVRALPEGTAIEVAGGITHENVRELHDAGANLLVVSTAVFEREDLPRAYRRLVQALA